MRGSRKLSRASSPATLDNRLDANDAPALREERINVLLAIHSSKKPQSAPILSYKVTGKDSSIEDKATINIENTASFMREEPSFLRLGKGSGRPKSIAPKL